MRKMYHVSDVFISSCDNTKTVETFKCLPAHDSNRKSALINFGRKLVKSALSKVSAEIGKRASSSRRAQRNKAAAYAIVADDAMRRARGSEDLAVAEYLDASVTDTSGGSLGELACHSIFKNRGPDTSDATSVLRRGSA